MEWIKNNKLSTALIVLVVLFLFRDLFSGLFGINTLSGGALKNVSAPLQMGVPLSSMGSVSSSYPYPVRESAPSDTKDRLVVQESSLSLVVLKVRESVDSITDQAKSVGGYMVSSNLSQPEDTPFATVTVRVPSSQLRSTLDSYRKLAVKVSSENIIGEDVTDEYVDIGSRLVTLETTKSKFESILESATQVQDILNIQREIISVQSQIDALKGQQKYLEQTAKLSKITVFLSSDEMALPYSPTNTFRPEVIFKTAVRSLVNNLRNLGSLLIWVVVYGVIWIPALAIFLWIKKWRKSKEAPVK